MRLITCFQETDLETLEPVIRVSQINASPIKPGNTIHLVIEGFQNPQNLEPIDGFQVKSMDLRDGLIQVSDVQSVRVDEPAEISDLSITLETGSKIIGERTGLRLDFNMPIPLSKDCFFKVKVP